MSHALVPAFVGICAIGLARRSSATGGDDHRVPQRPGFDGGVFA